MAAPSTKRFAIRRRLGQGGMGVVYEAFDEERRVPVALKALNRFDGNAIARFKREFRSLQGLAHPNLVALGELFFEADEWFFTMELLDGTDLVTHVRGGPGVPFQSTVRESVRRPLSLVEREDEEIVPRGFDEGKLRRAMRQLFEGLIALHEADKVHRDVKPSNIIVTREGRVVLLDFGLVTESSLDGRATGSGVVGTPAYMAPEQAASREIGPAADLYAVGVMLYELLTGRLPIKGGQLKILLEKQTLEPAPPSAIVTDLPADLDELCANLLRFDPAKRPTAREALLSLAAQTVAEAPVHRSSTGTTTFVGRSAELAELRVTYDLSARGQLSTVLVCGESGIGKSFTVRRFTGLITAEHPKAMLLEGRCYERETVPYKALDGIVDALSDRLSRMDASEVAALLPTRSAVLATVFPVLLRVPQVAREHAATKRDLEPQELRQRAFAALRDLFVRVAMSRPTVIVIDDLQWADDDGLRALAEVLRAPDPPPLLLIGTVRASPGAEDASFTRLRRAIPGENRIIRLARLGHADARALAIASLARADAPDADPEAIAAEADGHPLFVEELARHVAHGGAARRDVKLDDAIWSRVAELEPATREVAELVAVAGKPVPQEVVAAAAHVEPGEFHRRAATLRVSNVVRTGGARWADAIEPYHDRVREAVLAQLGPDRRRSRHEALAIAFEASAHHDAETLATHWREAGNGTRAAQYATQAGDQAARTFAFDRAAQWYEQALEQLPAHHAERRALGVKLGDALSNGGRGALAAHQFELAADQSSAVEALELRRRAADQLLRSGRFDRGIAASRTVLAAVGVRLPASRLETILLLIYYRARLKLRGLGFRAREKGSVSSETLIRIDACWSIGMALAFVDTIVGAVLVTRGLLLALSAGESGRIARALGTEIGMVSTAGAPAWERTSRLIERAVEVAAQSDSPQPRFTVTAGTGIAHYCNGHYRLAAEQLTALLDAFREGAVGGAYEQAAGRTYAILSLVFLGRFKELRRLQEEGLRQAVARGDVYAAVTLRIGYSSVSWLMGDRPDLAEENVRAAMSEWSKQGFHIEHYYGILANALVRLYVGDTQSAHALAGELLAKTKGSLLWRIQGMRIRSRLLRALAALAVPQPDLREAETLVRAIEREKTAWSQPFVTLLRAAQAYAQGEKEHACERLDAAARELEAGDMLAYAASARFHAASLRGDPAERERAVGYFRGEDVVAPERMIRMLVPGFGG